MHVLAIRVNRAEALLKSCGEYVLFLENEISEPGDQLLEKDASLSGYLERVFGLE